LTLFSKHLALLYQHCQKMHIRYYKRVYITAYVNTTLTFFKSAYYI